MCQILQKEIKQKQNQNHKQEHNKIDQPIQIQQNQKIREQNH